MLIKTVKIGRMVGGAVEPVVEEPAEDGWSPILSVETAGVGKVLRVSGWTGGSGSPPATGYLTDSGTFETDPLLAVRIDGAAIP